MTVLTMSRGSLGARPSFSIFRGSGSETSYRATTITWISYFSMMTQHFFGAQLLTVTTQGHHHLSSILAGGVWGRDQPGPGTGLE